MACPGQCTIRNVDAVDQGMWSSLNKTGFAVVLITIFILYSWDQLVSICRCICSARTTVVQVSSYRNAKVLNAVIRVRGIVTYDFQPTKDFQYVLRVIDGAIQVKGRRIVELNGSNWLLFLARSAPESGCRKQSRDHGSTFFQETEPVQRRFRSMAKQTKSIRHDMISHFVQYNENVSSVEWIHLNSFTSLFIF